MKAFAPSDIVTDFIKKVHFKGYTDQYMYSILNCAGSPEYTSRIIKKTAQKAGLCINGFYDVLMPGDYITQKKHLPPEKVQEYLDRCDEKIEEIAQGVRQKRNNYQKEKHSFLLSYGLHKLAVLEKTEPFIFGDACVRCGKCVDICPMETIVKINALADGDCFIHGDFHLENVMLDPNDQLVLIDMMNVCKGTELYDVARTYFLLSYDSNIQRKYLEKMGYSVEDIMPYLDVILRVRENEMRGTNI